MLVVNNYFWCVFIMCVFNYNVILTAMTIYIFCIIVLLFHVFHVFLFTEINQWFRLFIVMKVQINSVRLINPSSILNLLY